MFEDKRIPTQTARRYQFPPWIRRLVLWVVGITAAASIVATIASHTPKSSPRPNVIRQESKSKKILSRSEFKVKEGEWVGPIVKPREGWHWSGDWYSEKKIRVRMERRGKVIGEYHVGGGSPRVVMPASRPGDEFFITSLDGEQTVTFEWVDES